LKPFEPLAINLRNAKQPSDRSNGCIANSLLLQILTGSVAADGKAGK
jgi:hypothetical protein